MYSGVDSGTSSGSDDFSDSCAGSDGCIFLVLIPVVIIK